MKASTTLRKAAQKFDTSARRFVKELQARKAGRARRYQYPDYPTPHGCCAAINHLNSDYNSKIDANYFLRFFQPLHQPNGYWWAAPHDHTPWLEDVNARVLALLFAAEIAESIGD